MKYIDAFRALARLRTDQVVITPAGHASHAWWTATGDVNSTFHLTASMGMSTLFGAALALARPELKVWAFIGDGAFCMNPGTLMVERQMNLSNLTHILVSNRVYGATLDAPMVNYAHNDYPAIARGMGVERVFEFRTLEAIEREFPKVIDGKASGCTFVSLEVEPFGAYEKDQKVKGPPMEATEMKFLFGREIERRTGCDIFGYRLGGRA